MPQPPMTPFQDDPSLVKNPYYQDLYAKQAALQGLQLANAGKQQEIDLNDPAQQRVRAADDTAFQTGMINNGAHDTIDNYDLQKTMRTLAGKNEMQLNYEGDPRHLAPINAASEGKIAAEMAKGSAAGPKPLSAMSERTMATYEDTQQVAQHLIDLIDKYDPAAKDFSKSHGVLSQIPMVGSAMYKNYLYGKGFTDPNDDEQWLSGLLEAKGLAASLQGRPTQALVSILKQHLTDPSYDMGRNREAAQRLLNETQGFKQNLVNVHSGNYGTPAGRGGDSLGIR